jgi:hypothetical protein
MAKGSGLYPDDISYLEDALRAAFVDPGLSPSKHGVGWRRDKRYGTAELVPPADLVQRLDVLPQSYLAERKVASKLVLATTKEQGAARLAAALHDETNSSWPDAHYLGPLDPVLDWAADRALASLRRNEVFAVRGDVGSPTVALLGTMTNGRGQVVAAAWLSVEFPVTGDASFGFVTPHESAAKLLAALGWQTRRPNPGAVGGLDHLQALIPSAVTNAQAQMRDVFESAQRDVASRVSEWSRRLETWDTEADSLTQRRSLKQLRYSIRLERELVAAMNPDRTLVRPLLVVVPEEGDQA